MSPKITPNDSPTAVESPYEDLKKEKLSKKKKNPFDEMLEELETYEEGCDEKDLMSSGE
ncbi:hypothetical protein HYT55_05390 [Candidatus Woesearchaeota archaeon]|nr:hypothetical protein [Candidatus Woesearchaeota archaeon]